MKSNKLSSIFTILISIATSTAHGQSSCDEIITTYNQKWFQAKLAAGDSEKWFLDQVDQYNECTKSSSGTSISPECQAALDKYNQPWFQKLLASGSTEKWFTDAVAEYKSCTSGSTTITTGGTTTTTVSTAAKCSKWKPGHYIRVIDELNFDGTVLKNMRKIDGLSEMDKIIALDTKKNLKGFAFNFYWGLVEKSSTSTSISYDFRRIDAAVKKMKDTGRYLFLMPHDRTFHTTCDSKFIPPYVAREGGDPTKMNGANKCFAKVWERKTSDQYIRFLKALFGRYKDNPNVIGGIFGESAFSLKDPNNHPTYSLDALETEMIRMAQQVDQAVPTMIKSIGINYPQDREFFTNLANTLDKLQAGGSLTWPDSVPKWWSSEPTKRLHYEIARDYNKKLAIIAGIQTPFIEPSELNAVYDTFANKIGAQYLVWDKTDSLSGSTLSLDKYVGQYVLPVVNKYATFNSKYTNSCPY